MPCVSGRASPQAAGDESPAEVRGSQGPKDGEAKPTKKVWFYLSDDAIKRLGVQRRCRARTDPRR